MRTLSPYELATALAYTYTGTTPTDALLTRPPTATSATRLATAKTLLATDARQAGAAALLRECLDYPRAASMEKQNIATLATVRADMVQETRAFIDDVVIQKRGGLRELLTATTTNPSTALAHYGTATVPGASRRRSDYASVTRPAGWGIGVLAQGSVMAARAKTNSSSPTERGLLVYLRLLCETKPQLPDVVPPIGRAGARPDHDPPALRDAARASAAARSATSASIRSASASSTSTRAAATARTKTAWPSTRRAPSPAPTASRCSSSPTRSRW